MTDTEAIGATDVTAAVTEDPVAAAYDLYDRGLHPIPLPRIRQDEYGGKKVPYWYYQAKSSIPQQLAYTRLDRSHFEALFCESNVGLWVGRPAGNLVDVEGDDPEAVAFIERGLNDRGIIPWTYNSARGRHYLLRCREGEIANKESQSPHYGIRGHGRYSLAPPSVHPTGVRYEWVRRDGEQPPAVSVRDLDYLGASLWRPGRPAGNGGTLPPVAFEVLVACQLGRYTHAGREDHSAAEYAATLSLVGAGYTDDEIVAIFRLHRPPHFGARGEAWYRQYMLAPARKASTPCAGSAQNGGKPYRPAEEARQWARSRPWPGRTGTSDRAIYLALVDRMAMDRNSIIRGSVRELATLSGVSCPTACRTLDRLVSSGLVRREGEDSMSGARLYTLPQSPAPASQAVSPSVPPAPTASTPGQESVP